MPAPNDLLAILERIVNYQHTDADLEVLRQALTVNRTQKVVQIGKYTVNIGQGQDIQIGDRIYQGTDAETIKAVLREVLSELLQNRQVLTQLTVADGLGKLSNVPSLPPHFLYRSTQLATVRAMLLAEVKIGEAQRLVVHGMGGIGKSVLAAALARDEEVRRTFPDGVLWVTIGKEPKNLVPWQKYLIQELGSSKTQFNDVLIGRAILQELLTEKVCLLILDDVWEVEHAAAFNVFGVRCKLLVTTRNRSLVAELAATSYHLEVLSSEDALDLLARCAGQPLEMLPIEAQEVAQECGYLPLAVAMVGSILRSKSSRWDNVLHKLKQADLEKIRQKFCDYPYPDLLRAIEVSVEALDQKFQARYLDFACFPDNALIPEDALQTFWEPKGLDKYEAQDVIDELVDRSLVQRDERDCLTVHPLQFDYVHKRAGLPTFYERLLQKGIDTGCTPEEAAYIAINLVYHLLQCGRGEQIGKISLQLYT